MNQRVKEVPVFHVNLFDGGQAVDLRRQHGGGDLLHAHRIARDLVLQAVHEVRIQIVVLHPKSLVGAGIENRSGSMFIVVGDKNAAFTCGKPFGRLG